MSIALPLVRNVSRSNERKTHVSPTTTASTKSSAMISMRASALRRGAMFTARVCRYHDASASSQLMGASACGIVANMPAAFPIRWEFERRLETDKQRLAVALAISLALHGMIYAGWRVAPTVSAILKDAIARVLPKKFVELQPKPKLTPTPKHEVPMVFVEVDPALASKEPPKETKNYSTNNSPTANPKPKDLDVPKIEGSQTHVLRTTDNPKPQPTPLQPAPPPEPKVEPKPPEPKEPEVKPKPPPPIGDLAMNKTPLKALEPAIKTDDKAPDRKSTRLHSSH